MSPIALRRWRGIFSRNRNESAYKRRHLSGKGILNANLMGIDDLHGCYFRPREVANVGHFIAQPRRAGNDPGFKAKRDKLKTIAILVDGDTMRQGVDANESRHFDGQTGLFPNFMASASLTESFANHLPGSLGASTG